MAKISIKMSKKSEHYVTKINGIKIDVRAKNCLFN